MKDASEREACGTGADDGDFRRCDHVFVGVVIGGGLKVDNLASRSRAVATQLESELILLWRIVGA